MAEDRRLRRAGDRGRLPTIIRVYDNSAVRIQFTLQIPGDLFYIKTPGEIGRKTLDSDTDSGTDPDLHSDASIILSKVLLWGIRGLIRFLLASSSK